MGGDWAAYLVTVGTEPGVYDQWWQCNARIRGVPGAVFKGYRTKREALEQFRQAEAEGRTEVVYKADDDGSPAAATQVARMTVTVPQMAQLPTAPSTPTSSHVSLPATPARVRTVMSMSSSQSEASRTSRSVRRSSSSFQHPARSTFSDHYAIQSTSPRASIRSHRSMGSTSSGQTGVTVYEDGLPRGSRSARRDDRESVRRYTSSSGGTRSSRAPSAVASPARSTRPSGNTTAEVAASPRTTYTESTIDARSRSSRTSGSSRRETSTTYSNASAMDSPPSTPPRNHAATRLRTFSAPRFVMDMSSPESVELSLPHPAPAPATSRRTEEVARARATSSRRISRSHTIDVAVQAAPDVETPRMISRSHTIDVAVQAGPDIETPRRISRSHTADEVASSRTGSRAPSAAASPARSQVVNGLLPPLEELSMNDVEQRVRRAEFGFGDAVLPLRSEYERGADPRSPIHPSTSIPSFNRPSPSQLSIPSSALFGP